MDRRERRRRKRLEAKLKGKIIAEESSPSSMARKESRPLSSGTGEYFRRTISSTKLLWGLIVSAMTLLSGFVLFLPNVSIDPELLLNPGDPFSTQFSVTNENLIFDVKDLQPSCRTIHVITSNNVGMFGLPPRPSPSVALLSAREKTTINCPPWIDGLGAGAGNVLVAYIEIDVSYKQAGWPREKIQRFPFKGVTDSQHGVHWTHITLSELQTDLSRR